MNIFSMKVSQILGVLLYVSCFTAWYEGVLLHSLNIWGLDVCSFDAWSLGVIL